MKLRLNRIITEKSRWLNLVKVVDNYQGKAAEGIEIEAQGETKAKDEAKNKAKTKEKAKGRGQAQGHDLDKRTHRGESEDDDEKELKERIRWKLELELGINKRTVALERALAQGKTQHGSICGILNSNKIPNGIKVILYYELLAVE